MFDTCCYCDECNKSVDPSDAVILCDDCWSRLASPLFMCKPINLGNRGTFYGVEIKEYLCQHEHNPYLWFGNVLPDRCPNCGRKVQK